MKKLFILFCGLILGAAAALASIGFLSGDFIYRELKQPHLYQSLFSLADNSKKLTRITAAEQANGWQQEHIQSPLGYQLTGTFIPAEASRGTVIIAHGLFQNRSAGLDYYAIYHELGYNVLLADSRAHGASGGSSISWGYFEKYDLDAWVKWLQATQPNKPIGIHGISLGASTAVLHSELNEAAHAVDFYIIDSAYDDFGSLLKHQLSLLSRPDKVAQSHLDDALLFFIQAAAYYEDRISFSAISPMQAAAKAHTPMLFIHGGADTLVPVAMSEHLYAALPATKRIYITPEAPHASSIYKNRAAYREAVSDFLSSLNF